MNVGHGWVFSPDEDVESVLLRLYQKFPPLLPGDLSRPLRFYQKLGNPQNHLPPVFHVAGTNGKGSVLAFLQAVFEAAELSVHKYISPHLTRFEERITVNGALVPKDILLNLIVQGESAAGDEPLSFFEFFTGLAFLAFARTPADVVLLETGLGGRLDATNVVAHPEASIITRISHDHNRLLGDTLADIACEKAGIMRENVPVIIGPQKDISVMRVFEEKAREVGAKIYKGFSISIQEKKFLYSGENMHFSLPYPRLLGRHQIDNAATAIAAIEKSSFSELKNEDILARAMQTVSWPGRLQRLSVGPLVSLLPTGWELWLDGAHNDSGAEALAEQISLWGADKPLHLLTAFKQGKDIASFYGPLRHGVATITAVEANIQAPMLSAEKLRQSLVDIGYDNPAFAENLESAVRGLIFTSSRPGRILVTGSLYLVGLVLRTHT